VSWRGSVDVGALELYVERHGAGTPLVLLHGALGTIETCFGDLVPRLAARFDVIAVELQGHGHTADADRDLCYDALADDVAALLRALDVGPAHVVGFSLGGAVGLRLAVAHRSLVRRVVFAGGAAFDSSALHPEARAALESFNPHELDGSAWHEAYQSVAPDPDGWSALVAKVNELDRAAASIERTQLIAMDVPVLLVVGDADLVPLTHTVELFELLGGGVAGDLVDLPASRLAVLPGTTHVGVLERVDWVESMLLDFLP
jgi:pimeloyl-ACP methyl ester carboxylesterase